MRTVALLVLLSLAGCAVTPVAPTPVNIHTTASVLCSDAPPVTPLQLKTITWVSVWGYDNSKGQSDTAVSSPWIAVSPDDYLVLSEDMNQINRQSHELMAQRDYYKDCAQRSIEASTTIPVAPTQIVQPCVSHWWKPWSKCPK